MNEPRLLGHQEFADGTVAPIVGTTRIIERKDAWGRPCKMLEVVPAPGLAVGPGDTFEASTTVTFDDG